MFCSFVIRDIGFKAKGHVDKYVLLYVSDFLLDSYISLNYYKEQLTFFKRFRCYSLKIVILTLIGSQCLFRCVQMLP